MEGAQTATAEEVGGVGEVVSQSTLSQGGDLRILWLAERTALRLLRSVRAGGSCAAVKLFAKKRLTFPDPASALDDGIIDLSDDLRIERLLEAYSFGIFPWPHEDLPTLWFSPEQRGVLDFKNFHV